MDLIMDRAQKLVARSFPSWDSSPIPNASLSAGGLLALADLQTVANRTAITGGSTWLDALVLAPGLHYQQAADGLDQRTSPSFFAESQGGGPASISAKATSPSSADDDGKTDHSAPVAAADPATRYEIRNSPLAHLLSKLGDDGSATDFVYDVGQNVNEGVFQRLKRLFRIKRRLKTQAAVEAHVDWLSDILYLASPLFTAASIVFMVLFRDWWGFVLVLALILSRIINIFVIKRRSKYNLPPTDPSNGVSNGGSSSNGNANNKNNKSKDNATAVADQQPTEYTVDLGTGRKVRLRGSPADLNAICTQAWLQRMTQVQGFLEAMSKLIVYLVAALSGNLTQIGNLILMVLLLANAGLLGLSNANAQGFRMHGRVATRQRGKPASAANGQNGLRSQGVGPGTNGAAAGGYSDQDMGGRQVQPGDIA